MSGAAWRRVCVEEVFRVRGEQRAKVWIDWVTGDGAWKAGEGYNEPARKDGLPWTLFRRDAKGHYHRFRECRSLLACKALAACVEQIEADTAALAELRGR